jgi:putative nucleotidyltransferase with HDIG domain
MNREEAWTLVCEWTAGESLRRHMLSVEAAMRHYAAQFGEDVERWGLVGLLHDFDYERYPDMENGGHPVAGSGVLRERGVDEEMIRAILAHGYERTGVMPESSMEKTLVAVDELTGFITAVTLVRPSKNIADVEIKSIKGKWKDKAFARPVNREEIAHHTENLGIELWTHVQTVLDAMKGISEPLGLDGSAA